MAHCDVNAVNFVMKVPLTTRAIYDRIVENFPLSPLKKLRWLTNGNLKKTENVVNGTFLAIEIVKKNRLRHSKARIINTEEDI